MVTSSSAEPVAAPRPAAAVLAAVLAVAYAGASYLAFVATTLYAVAFTADLLVPRTVDHGGPVTGTAVALLVDVVLLGLFAVQHSVMARPGFKRRWTRLVPRTVERATYVCAASAVLALLCWWWHPVPTVLWDVSWPVGRVLLWALLWAGWAWVGLMSFAVDHWQLFGLRQVARNLRGLADREPSFALPWPHRLVRHPMMLGFFPALLAAPTMTVGHLVFGGLGCLYVLVGIRLEEHDLTAELPEYADYAARTPRLLPRPPLR